MPLFEFACQACGHRFETLVMGSRMPVCPACASTALEKLVSSFATGSSGGRASGGGARPFT
jgi:putative FmdB family regulatory protein